MNIKKIFDNAPDPARDLLSEIIMEAILNSDHPEESKIEIRLVKTIRDIQRLIESIADDFALPMDHNEPEANAVQKQALPARQQCLEYLELVKGGLETFRQQVPAPEIPEKYRKRAEDACR